MRNFTFRRVYSTVSSNDSLKPAETKNRITITKDADKNKQSSSIKNFMASATGVAAGSAVVSWYFIFCKNTWFYLSIIGTNDFKR